VGPVHVQHPLERRVVRAYLETGPFNVKAEKEGCPHNREAIPLRCAVNPLRRVEGAAPITHGPRGLVGLFLKKNRADLPRTCVRVQLVGPLSPRQGRDGGLRESPL